MRRFVLIVLSFAFVASSAAADDCRYSADRRAELDAKGARRLLIESGAGFLVVEGREGSDRVVVEATACSDDEDLLEEIRLDTGRRGDRLEVIADMPNNKGWGWKSHHATLDMTVRVPADLELEIEDGSGSIELTSIGQVEVDDGSGGIRIERSSGDVRIEDGSGEITARGIRGDIRIDDGSGGIDLRDVEGAVTLSDGSGEIEVEGVGRDVEIDDDGSGSIWIRDVQGDVRIGSDGSGSIDVEEVSGSFEVRRDGSGGIHYRDIEGSVSVPRG